MLSPDNEFIVNIAGCQGIITNFIYDARESFRFLGDKSFGPAAKLNLAAAAGDKQTSINVVFNFTGF